MRKAESNWRRILAGDWLKMEVSLPEKPEVWQIAGILRIDPDAVVGKLLKVWRWFDAHTENGNAVGVTYALVDSISGVTGFGEAMALCSWLEQDGSVLRLPRFGRHNGKTAKNRALTAKRVASHKEKSNAEGNAPGVSDALPREEKRREEKKEQDQKKSGADKPRSGLPRTKSDRQTFATFVADCRAKGEKPITEEHPIFAFAESAGIPVEFVRLAWFEFRRTFGAGGKDEKKTQAGARGWRAHFDNAVRRNWFKLWWFNGEQCELTTAGVALQREADAAAKVAA
jgi:hypothetical protein